MLDTVEQKQITDVLAELPDKVVVSNLVDKAYPYKKTVIRKILLKGKEAYQIERFTDRQAFHENVEMDALAEVVLEQFPFIYSQLNIFCTQRQWSYRVTKKGKLLSNVHESKNVMPVQRRETASCADTADDMPNRKRIVVDGAKVASHNRQKRYLLKEGTVIPPLVDLGIFTKDGKVVRTMYDKYKQINRFLELVEDVVKEKPEREMHIIDFGCGKSYLTFILYYYLVEVKGYRVQMTGLDLKEAVIERCNETARKYHYENLHFELGDINGYQTQGPVDMVITLHACDTATDYALYNAITWKAGMILSVPCCQHELHTQIHTEELALLTRYGIVKERVSALMTDAIRANVLEYCGYQTQLLEFVDLAHSPKNILIRAVKGTVSAAKRERAKKEIEQMQDAFQLEQTLARLVLPQHGQREP